MKYLAIFLPITCLIASCNTLIEEKKINDKNTLPIYGEKKLSGNAEDADTIFHQVGPFKFCNQYGDTIDEKITADKIYVAYFFFATCQSICPKMSSQLSRLQDSIKNDREIIILSHTVNPMHDTVEVLNTYGKKYGAIKGKWHLLTGSKKSIYK